MEPVHAPEQDAWFDLDLDAATSSPRVQLRRRPVVRRGDVTSRTAFLESSQAAP